MHGSINGAPSLDDRLADDELGDAARHGRDERTEAEECGADGEDAAVAVDVAEAPPMMRNVANVSE